MSEMPATPPPVVLHVCTTCRAGGPRLDGVPVPGQVLHDRLAALLAPGGSPAVEVRGVECLAVCEQGCAAAISAGAKWSYLVGRLAPEQAPDLAAFAHLYARSRTGTVMPSHRPPSLARMVLGRIPGAAAGQPG